MTPSSLAKMKRAAPAPTGSRKCVGSAVASWKTRPVGPPSTATTIGTIAPVFPLYRVDLSVSLSATQNGVDGPATRPHALTRFASCVGAAPMTSETSGCSVYALFTAAEAATVVTIASSTAAPAKPKRAFAFISLSFPAGLENASGPAAKRFPRSRLPETGDTSRPVIQEAIQKLLDGHDLDRADARRVMGEIMGGEATPAQIGGFLVALRAKGETADEI